MMTLVVAGSGNWRKSIAADALPSSSDQAAVARKTTYRAFVDSHQGDPQRGKQVFENEQKATCRKCHTLDANRKGVGPDLLSIGDKFERPDLITSVLEPSKTIAVGYGATNVITTSGLIVQGVLQRVTDTGVELRNKDGQLVRVPANEIDEQQTSELSLMPEGLETQLTTQEYTDLIAYLGTLKQPRNATRQRPEVPDEIARATQQVNLVPLFGDSIRLDHPVWIGAVPGRTGTYIALEHFGRIWTIQQSVSGQKNASGDSQHAFLDLSSVVRRGGATGLLGFAFHPRFVENGRYVIKYQIADNNQIGTIVEERKWDAERATDLASQTPRQILRIVGSTQDHNGGCLTFGPDGFLYIGMGDSGPQEDPQGHGQDLTTLLGKILRIDIDSTDGDRPYGIPRTNPFVTAPDARPEVWAYGFREPWRFSFDTANGEMWVGDVGQNRFEEVAIVKAGENHGWNVYEGFADHSNRFRSADARYVPPVIAYPRRLGVSVTGGYVYRGKRAPQLQGWYVFGDFESRRIWALRQQDRRLVEVVEIGRSPTRIVSFNENPDGEIDMVGYDTGTIYRLNLDQVDLKPLDTRAVADTSEADPVPWLFTLSAPTGDWQRPDFNDADWKSAPGGFGTNGTPGGVIRTDWRTRDIWLRRSFDLSQVPSPQSLALRIHHDEDVVVYLNGVEAVRRNGWTTGYIEVPIDPRAVEALRTGRNVIAIHCHQNGGGQYIDAGLVDYVKAK